MRTGIIPGAANFTYEEMVRSTTALKQGINNRPTSANIWDNIEYLAQKVLQPVRNEFGSPVIVTSGYRSKELNRYIGGSSTSHHVYGCAADIRVKNVAPRDVFDYIYWSLPFTELIAENLGGNVWVHVALAKGREMEKAVKYQMTGSVVRRASHAYIMALQW